MIDRTASGRNFASERMKLDLTQEQLANELGTNTKSISQYENGVYALPPEIANAMADMCGCSTDYLYARTDERLSARNATAAFATIGGE